MGRHRKSPSTPKSHRRGMSPATEWKFCLIYFLLFVKTRSKFGIKIFEIDMVTEVLWYSTFWPHSKVTSLTLGWKFYLHSVLLVIPVDLICNMTMFGFFLTPWAPQRPLSPTPGAWPRRENENPVWYVLYLSFVKTHTKARCCKHCESLCIYLSLISPKHASHIHLVWPAVIKWRLL